MDRKKEPIERFRYEFELRRRHHPGLARTGERFPSRPRAQPGPITSDHTPEEYMANVEKVREGMRRGDYYEVVLRQTFRTPYSGKASELFERDAARQPQPLRVSAPVRRRATGGRIARNVRARGRRARRDLPHLRHRAPHRRSAARCGEHPRTAESAKEESELTMCTDVDRNDKSRVCVPGTVKVIGRRLIESYAGVFHTVDHVEGISQEGFDSLDAFLTHMWAVTVIGAPKKAAAQAIENLEKNARGWYGGAVGMISLEWRHQHRHPDPHHVSARRRSATYPAGATLLYDSDPGVRRARNAPQGTVFPRCSARAGRRRRAEPRTKPTGASAEAAAGG